jgi:hypothetical protein
MKQNRHVTILALFFVSFAARWTIGRYSLLSGRPLDWFPLCRVFEFGLGVYLSMLWTNSPSLVLHGKLKQCLVYLGDMAFPMFLVHHPYILALRFLVKHRVPVAVSLSMYLAFIAGLSIILLHFDRYFRRA